ncbi:hypothetical protein PR048_002912 [Dryococelus australis]|uniref:Uncharacterized protein n=1 Tax=Dryococelus australis TaxID=614101 RepID=A0ABQ9INU1_9NEOP|nr:hypothetical protein PR048_002912 [Dryococelus australis]
MVSEMTNEDPNFATMVGKCEEEYIALLNGRMKLRRMWTNAGLLCQGKRVTPEKIHPTEASSNTIFTCQNPIVTMSGVEPISPDRDESPSSCANHGPTFDLENTTFVYRLFVFLISSKLVFIPSRGYGHIGVVSEFSLEMLILLFTRALPRDATLASTVAPSHPLASVMALEPRPASQQKQYDYLLKFLLVGDSDVGKQEILSGLEDGSSESPFCSGSAYKTTTILLDGKRVKLQLWDTSGQGRFLYHNTLIFSRGAGHSVGLRYNKQMVLRWDRPSLHGSDSDGEQSTSLALQVMGIMVVEWKCRYQGPSSFWAPKLQTFLQLDMSNGYLSGL